VSQHELHGNGQVTVQLGSEVTTGTISILDALGRSVLRQSFQGSGTIELDLSQHKAGIYTVLFQSGEAFHSQKLMIE